MVLAMCLIIPHNLVSLAGIAGLGVMVAFKFLRKTAGGEVRNG